ncbi:MAG: discoidin domain-containing protein [Tannerellaceae bacterium]|nr:discoidin domain-containing protein [Tannerellaceae bacterium]
MKKVFLILVVILSVLTMEAQEKQKAYIVSNAHFDSQWNWDVQRSISEYIPKTLNQNLMLLEKYPNYVFNFEGGIKYYWMKEYFPHQYELMKEYIRQGRWQVNGSTWDATDPNIPSPESFTRNILYGQHFYRDEFGVESTDIFLPDCFGFGWTLPTMAAHSGLIGFSTQKLMWRHKPFHGTSKIPFEIGLWEGVDGARIMMVADAHNYTTKWRDEDLSNSEYLYNLTDTSYIKTVYHYYGTGDTGGAPTIESVRAVEKGVQGEGPVEIISATSDQLFKDYLPFDKHPELHVYTGELLMDVHATGCYTSQAAMKLYNRRNELLADASERSAVIADWLGALPYPKATLSEAWKRFIWHQFHDDLTGTSIPRAYEFSWNDELISLQQFANVLTSTAGAASRVLDTQVKGIPLVIYNPAAFPVSDVIEVTIPANGDKFTVYNEKGIQVPSQVTGREDGNVKILVSATAPAMGYVVYDLRTGGNTATSKTLQVLGHTIENSIYKVTLDKNGDIGSILDKRNGKELVENGKAIRLALFTENESFAWPAWEILKKEIDKDPVSITGDVKISVAEAGSLRAALCVERTYGESTFKQYIRLSEGGQSDRIDIVNEIDWQSTNALLKAEFPLAVSNPKATYDLGIGAIERGNNTETAYEVYAQYWADLTHTNGEYGVSVLNDSKYGWDKPNDNTIRLTLLHTPKTRGGYAYQDKQDFGRHHFTYSIIGHAGSYQEAGTVLKAEILNQPLNAFVAPKHKGSYGKSLSFAATDNENVVLKAFKQAEKSDEYIVRFYETTGKSNQKVNFTFLADIVSAKEINGVEDETGHVDFSGKNLSFEIKPFNIRSFKVKLTSPGKPLSVPASTPVALPYNMKTASYNAFRQDANFDGKGQSYAAELLPEEITFKGVRFELAPADVPNGVKCRQDTIDLPKGNYNRLYILAASSQYDNTVTFEVDGKKHTALIPFYSGFIGQWGHTGHTEGFIKHADLAYIGTHKHDMIRNQDVPYEFTYIFSVALDIPANASQLVLPDNSRIVVFAASLLQDENNVLAPATDLKRIYLPEKGSDEAMAFNKNLLYEKPVIDRSGEVNRREKAEFALDEDTNTKWCDVSIAKPKFITVDMGKIEEVRGWSVFHAGLESLDYITKEYSLQLKEHENDEWKTVDTVYDNNALETDRLLSTPQKARYVRLLVTKPDQSEGNTVRIYEFAVY